MPDFCAKCGYDFQRGDDWHCLSCPSLRGVQHTRRHNEVVLCVSGFVDNVGGFSHVEPSGIGLARKDRTRPDADLYLSGRRFVIDASIVHPLAPSHTELAASKKLAVAMRREREKRTRWEEKCAARGAVFFPVVLETLGGFGGDSAELFKELCAAPGIRFVSDNFSIRALRERLSLCVARWTAVCVRECMYSISD